MAHDYLKGVYNITPTPFHPDGSLDEASLHTLTRFNVDKGVDGMTILGVMGETGKVTDAERDQIIAGVLEAANGELPICVGTTHGGTDGCVAYSKRAQALGAKAVMVAPPQLARSNEEAMRRHYLTVAAAIDIPIVVQDHPASSRVYMSVELITRLAEEAPQCNFLKLEDVPCPPKVAKVRAAKPDMVIFGGLGGMMFLEELKSGADGTMTGFGFPDILVDIHRKYLRGDIDGATATFYYYCPLIRFEAQDGISMTLRKEIYARRGAIASAQARRPYAALDEGTLRDLDDLLTRLGLQGK
jgi:4-hydroxy-tetrahydrodipicolinate synthase